jgi:hypothetical protein
MRCDDYSGDLDAQIGRVKGWLDDLHVSLRGVTFEKHDADDMIVVKIPLNDLYYVHVCFTHQTREGRKVILEGKEYGQTIFEGWGMSGALCHVKGRGRDLHDSIYSTRLDLARIFIDAAHKMPAADQNPVGKVKPPPLED